MTETKSVMVRRRTFIKGASAVGLALGGARRSSPAAAMRPTRRRVVNSIRSLSNPYHATWNKGGEAFAKSVGAEYVTLVTEGNSEKGIADIKAILAKTGGNCVINVDPNDSPDARPIVEACQAAGAYVVTQWNKPADLHPWDHDPNYVAHISFSGVPYGKAMAEALIKAMGGKGGIVALGGIQSNVPAIERKAGLDAGARGQPGRQAARLPGGQLVGDRGAREDQRLAHPVRRRDRRHLGGQRRHGARRASRRCAPTAAPARCRSPASTASSSRSRRSWPARWPAPSPGIRSGRAAWASRSATTPRPARSTRRRSPRSTASSTAPASPVTAENAQAFYDENIKAEPQLDWNDIWGRVDRADPVQLTRRGRARRRRAPRAPCLAKDHAVEQQPQRERSRGGARARWRLAAWAPLAVLVALCVIIAVDQPQLPHASATSSASARRR